VFRASGPVEVPETVLAMCGAGLPGQGVHPAGPSGRAAAGAAHDTGVLVGDRPIRHEHASVAGIARQLGTTWNTGWAAVRPLLEAMADGDSRFTGPARPGSASTSVSGTTCPNARPIRWVRVEVPDRDGRPDPGPRRGPRGRGRWTWLRAGPARPTATGSTPADRYSVTV